METGHTLCRPANTIRGTEGHTWSTTQTQLGEHEGGVQTSTLSDPTGTCSCNCVGNICPAKLELTKLIDKMCTGLFQYNWNLPHCTTVMEPFVLLHVHIKHRGNIKYDVVTHATLQTLMDCILSSLSSHPLSLSPLRLSVPSFASVPAL